MNTSHKTAQQSTMEGTIAIQEPEKPTHESSAEHYGTIVIGGGQAGLSVGYHLTKRGIPFVILAAGKRVGDAWRTRWDFLRLFTSAAYNGLDGLPFPAPP